MTMQRAGALLGRALVIALLAFLIFGPLANLLLWAFAERWYFPAKIPQETAAREIKALMGTSVDRVEKGAALVGQAGETMEHVVTSIERVTALVSAISAASSEQSVSIGQVEQAVTQLYQVTQQNAALVEQSAAASESLRDQAQRLIHTVSAFRTADRTAASPAV